MDSCKNCNEPINGNYCSNCGQPAKLRRIDMHYIISEIADFFFAHKGMIYTIKNVLIRPGESVRRFISEDRFRFVKPITFLILTSLVYTLVLHLFSIDAKEFLLQEQKEVPTANLFINWIIDNSGYTNIIIGFIVAFWVKLFFRKSGYNLYEIYILLCFIFGIMMLFSSVMMILQGVLHLKLILFSNIVFFIYNSWAIGQFFDRRKVGSYVKAFISCLLAYLIFGILVGIVATFIDLVIKQPMV